MASLGRLVVSLAVDTARFQGDLGRAAAVAEARMRNIKDTATRALGAVAAAAGAAGGALVVALQAAANRADDLVKLAQASGVTVEQLSRLEYAAKLSGVETETLGKALQRLAAAGAPDANEALLALADRFAKMPDGAAKTALAIETFGQRLGPGLIPLLNSGREGLQAFAAESDRLGNTISTNTARQAEALNDNLTRLQVAASGLANRLLAEVVPGLSRYAEALATGVTQSQALGGSVSAVGSIIRGMISTADRAAVTFSSFAKTIGAAAAVAASAARGDFSAAAEIIRQRNADAAAETAALQERLKALYSDATTAPIAAAAPRVAAAIVAPISEASRKAREEAEQLRQLAVSNLKFLDNAQSRVAMQRQFEADVQVLTNSVGTVDLAGSVANDLQAVREALQGVGETSIYAQRAAENMQDSLANFFMTAEGGFRGLAVSLVNTLRQVVAQQAAASFLNSSVGKGVTGFIGSLFGGFRAEGGPVLSGRSYIVGERGPELFVPGSSGSIVPNDRMGGGNLTVAPVYNISGLGLSFEQVQLLMQRNNRELVRQITDPRMR
jgi:hypothetical protein